MGERRFQWVLAPGDAVDESLYTETIAGFSSVDPQPRSYEEFVQQTSPSPTEPSPTEPSPTEP